MSLGSICVYCGSSKGDDPMYVEMAEKLGALLVKKNINLVYGAGSVGLMGVLADAVLAGGGKVIGVIPTFLEDREVGHNGLSEKHVVNDMHIRKKKMMELSDGFIAMPGGMGTLEELSEVLTWGQLKLHHKPVGLLNVKGYYDKLLSFLDHSVKESFLRRTNREQVLHHAEPEGLLRLMEGYLPLQEDKWIKK